MPFHRRAGSWDGTATSLFPSGMTLISNGPSPRLGLQLRHLVTVMPRVLAHTDKMNGHVKNRGLSFSIDGWIVAKPGISILRLSFRVWEFPL